MNQIDIALKRSIVFSARIQFAPEAQPLRETAIDRIMEQNLLLADSEGGITVQEMEEQGALCFEDGTPAIGREDMEKSLRRLKSRGRVRIIGVKTEHHYRLSDTAHQEMMELQRNAEKRLESVVGRLFRNTEEGPLPYRVPFFECLCIIFSRLGEMYVRLIQGQISHQQFVRSPTVVRALSEIRNSYPSIDWSVFEYGVFSFFQDTDPDYDAIKWNMAQNYYVAKALGLDPSGHLLSKEVFSNAVFYLDTNVAIDALDPDAAHHRSFQTLSNACEQLQIQLSICQISLDELRLVVLSQREVLEKVADQIPADMYRRIRGDFFHIYRERKASTGEVDFDKLFSRFVNARDELARDYNIGLIDDRWFNEAVSHPRTQQIVDTIKYQYIITTRRRSKAPASALHDALLLQWVQLERRRGTKNTWVVTRDTSLPEVVILEEGESARPLAITLDALLQWISPIAVQGNPEDEFAGVFSQALKYMLLPQENFFDLGDFRMFAQMEWSCKELPADDIEACIRYIKTNAPGLDVSNPCDREKIAHVMTKFFADPGRKFKQEQQRLEKEIGLEQQKVELKNGEIQTLERDVLRASGRFRLFIVFLFSAVCETTILYLAGKHAEGTNFFQKMLNSWPFLSGIPVVIFVLLSLLIVGKKRLLALGWPFSKLFQVDQHQGDVLPANNSKGNSGMK
jgi:hypothetical protein